MSFRPISGEVSGESDSRPETVGQRAIGRHQFEIRFILVGRPARDFGQDLAAMLAIVWPELAERGEEMIVGGFAARHEIAHREAVDHRAGERIVGLGAYGLHAVFAATARERRHDRVRSQVQTESVFGGDAQISLGVHGAAGVQVQIASLRHSQQEGV